MENWMKRMICTLLVSCSVLIVSSGQVKNKVDSLMAKISNENFEYGTFRPVEAKTVLLERKILIIKPSEAIAVVKLGKGAANDLLIYFDDERRDWVAHVLLSAIFEEDPMLIQHYTSIQEWKESSKIHDRKYWEKKIK